MSLYNYLIEILAGSRPCGIIVFLSDLFTAELKTQVYGCLHNYYSLHPSTANSIGRMITNCVMCSGTVSLDYIRLMMHVI